MRRSRCGASLVLAALACGGARGQEDPVQDDLRVHPPAAPDREGRFVLLGFTEPGAGESSKERRPALWELCPERAADGVVLRAELPPSPWAPMAEAGPEVLRLQVPVPGFYVVHLYWYDPITGAVRLLGQVDQAHGMGRYGHRAFVRVGRGRDVRDVRIVDVRTGEVSAPSASMKLLDLRPLQNRDLWLVRLDPPGDDGHTGGLYSPEEDALLTTFPLPDDLGAWTEDAREVAVSPDLQHLVRVEPFVWPAGVEPGQVVLETGVVVRRLADGTERRHVVRAPCIPGSGLPVLHQPVAPRFDEAGRLLLPTWPDDAAADAERRFDLLRVDCATGAVERLPGAYEPPIRHGPAPDEVPARLRAAYDALPAYTHPEHRLALAALATAGVKVEAPRAWDAITIASSDDGRWLLAWLRDRGTVALIDLPAASVREVPAPAGARVDSGHWVDPE